MRMRLANLLIKYTPCSVTIRTLETSLEWTWRGNSLKWGLLAPVGMQIILVDKNMLKTVLLDPRRQTHYTVSKQDRQESLKRKGI